MEISYSIKAGAFSIDLVVEGDNDQRLAIELDGDQYHSPDKWHEDWKRQRILERVGWKFWRCWGSAYIQNPEDCIKELICLLDEMGIKPIENNTPELKHSEKRIWTRPEIENKHF